MLGEVEHLKDRWMSEFLDSGNAKTAKANKDITDCACPRCGKKMEHIKHTYQPHIGYEANADQGGFFLMLEIYRAERAHFIWENDQLSP